ncbi:MAG: GDP-mannose 4,6-dehydratase, partial [Gammaproteobacteria bacterium]
IGGLNEWYNIDIVNLICDRLDEIKPAAQSYRDQVTYVRDRPGHDRRYAIDAGKMKTELGWSPRHDFSAGIEATIQWYLANLPWCDRVRSGAYQDYYAQQYG